jgi:hypothetical protein
MAFAATLILGMLPIARAGETDLARLGSVMLQPVSITLASWRAGTESTPGSKGDPSYLIEEDEDDTVDDAPLDSAPGIDSTDPLFASGHGLTCLGPRRVISRSASPSLRLRC